MFFIFGSGVPVLNSIILRGEFPWENGLFLRFRKPWFQLTTMFLGMTVFIIPSLLYKRFRSHTPGYMNVNMSPDLYRKVVLPSVCNIIATGLQNKALMSIPITVWQVFFGFRVLFATLFAVTYRRQRLMLVDWLGLFVSVSGMSFSGVAALLRGIAHNDSDEVSGIFFGFIIVILSHGIQAFQTIIEERLLHDEGINGATLTAYEGMWGLFVCVFIILPICQVINPTDGIGLYENSLETFKMLGKSTSLVMLVVAFLFMVTLFSYFGIAVTDTSTAIHRNMYETVRPLPVWILSALLYYSTHENQGIGEPIDKFTALELTGFAVSVLGSCIYNRVLKFPCFIYLDDDWGSQKEDFPRKRERRPVVSTGLLDQPATPPYTDPPS